MAGSICDYLENELLDHVMMKGAFSPAASLYLGLSSTTITDAGGNITEPGGGAYARVEVAPASWAAAAARAVATSAAITFPTATGSWGDDLTDWFLSDAAAAGNIYAAGTLTDGPVTIGTNDVYQIPATNLSITFSTGGISTYLANKLLDRAFNGTAYTPPSNIYTALSTANPTDDGSGLAEPSGGSYARVSSAGGDWNAAAAGVVDNASLLSYATATGAWGTITHGAMFDALAAGNMLFYGQLDESKNVVTGNTFKWPVGLLAASMG